MKKFRNRLAVLAAAAVTAVLLGGCGGKEDPDSGNAGMAEVLGEKGVFAGEGEGKAEQSGTGIAGESAKDTQVDFEALKRKILTSLHGCTYRGQTLTVRCCRAHRRMIFTKAMMPTERKAGKAPCIQNLPTSQICVISIQLFMERHL